ncbi:hypothetical protein IG631_04092 [Alternaria alternata]|jgi:hypothetical protein|nr:hypothetical protein IG631_04092 [Alternaria alternata]
MVDLNEVGEATMLPNLPATQPPQSSSHVRPEQEQILGMTQPNFFLLNNFGRRVDTFQELRSR